MSKITCLKEKNERVSIEHVPLQERLSIHDLIILESIPDSELHTGKQLFGNLEHHLGSNMRSIQHVPVRSKKLLFNAFDKLIRDSKCRSLRPVLHLEVHGSMESIALASGEIIDWNELYTPIAQLHVACDLNLLVTMSACYGAYAHQILDISKRAPFFALIGPNKELLPNDLISDYTAFYRVLFKTLDGSKALAALKSSATSGGRIYTFLSSVGLFLNIWSAYHSLRCTGRGKQQRINELITEARELFQLSTEAIPELRRYFKQCLKHESLELQFEEYERPPAKAGGFGLRLKPVRSAFGRLSPA